MSASAIPSMRTVRTTPPAPGEQTELHLGEAQLHLRVVDGDAVVAGQADLQAAAERGAVDRRDDGHAEGLQAAQLGLDRPHHLGELRSVVLARRLQVVEVAPGEERVLGRRDHDAGDRRPSRPRAARSSRPSIPRTRVHRVGRLVRVVERQHDDPVVVLVPADGGALGHDQIASTTVAIPMPPPTHNVARP